MLKQVECRNNIELLMEFVAHDGERANDGFDSKLG
jgi:hypothetical protein